MMKNPRLKVFVIGFFCVSCCSWTSVAGDDLQKALGLLKAKLLNLANELDSEVNLSEHSLTKSGVIGEYAVYNIPVLSQENGGGLTNISGYSYYKIGYGCGINAIKNTIFMTMFLLEKNKNKREEILAKMKNPEVFLHYFEGKKNNNISTAWQSRWDGESEKQTNWVTEWLKKRKAAGMTTAHFAEPSARPADVSNLIEKMIQGDVIAPQGSQEALKKIIKLGNVMGTQRTEGYNCQIIVNNDDINKIKEAMKNSRYILPMIGRWTHSKGAHTLMVVIRKTKRGKKEILFADSSNNKSYNSWPNEFFIQKIIDFIKTFET